MRATTRITWLLLSLSFLFQIVCSSNDNESTKSAASDTTAPKPVSSNSSQTGEGPGAATTGSKPMTGGPIITPLTDDAGKKNLSTQAPTNTTTAVPMSAIQAAATSKPTVASVSVASGATTTGVNDTTSATAATTSSQPQAITPAVTDNSSAVLAVSTSVATVQTPEASVPSETSTTKAPASVGTTKIQNVSTGAPTTSQESKAHTTVTSQTSQADSKGVTKETTATVGSLRQTTSGAPQPAGSTGTTSNPSTPTAAGLPATQTLNSKTETPARWTTPTPTSSPTTNPAPGPAITTANTTATIMTTTTPASQLKAFLYSLNNGREKEEEKELVEVCKRLMANLKDGNCSLIWRNHNGKVLFDRVEINGEVKTSLANDYYEEINKKPTDNKTLIAILASCGALLIMIVILAVCASHHRKPYSENQQHLTEELHTVENGYHDNPTLEVMEVQPEMQEKKMALNGEFNDSWIVPFDNLLKEDMPDEEDTHL